MRVVNLIFYPTLSITHTHKRRLGVKDDRQETYPQRGLLCSIGDIVRSNAADRIGSYEDLFQTTCVGNSQQDQQG